MHRRNAWDSRDGFASTRCAVCGASNTHADRIARFPGLTLKP
jgi:hypothetical protein